MKLLQIAAASATLLLADAAYPCGPCGSGVDCPHIADICRQDLWSAEFACVEAVCAAPCAASIAAVQSGTCDSVPSDDACDACMTAPDPMGCGAEVSACGFDRTGGVTCAAWLTASADPADLLPYDSLTAAYDLSECACNGPCGPAASGPCTYDDAAPSACGQYAPEDYYLVPALASNGCVKCEEKRCGSQLAACENL